jgi:two-component system, cell cycle response regulator DivK
MRNRQRGDTLMQKILIVEDNADNRELLWQTLEYDYELVVAENGKQALEKAASFRPDLILMDLSMPVMSGWEAVGKLKMDVDLSAIPVIAVSSNAMVGDRERALEAGCNDYVSKPISPELLLIKVAEWLGGEEHP